MASIDALKEILIPPDDPVLTGLPEQWIAFEARLGMRLPRDFSALITTYGAGSPNDWFVLLNPFFDASFNFERWLALHRQDYRESYSQAGPDTFEGLDGTVPHGLVPFAHGSDGSTAYWNTHLENPDDWTIMEEREFYWQSFRGTTIEYLMEVITGQYRSIVYGPLPRELPVRFLPWRPLPGGA